MTELALRARRAAFNRAIADKDPTTIAAILARDCVMITGTDSAVIAGRMAQVKVWKREFAAPHRMIYERLPNSITLSPVEPIAQELGEWQGKDASGAVAASGVYSAKWRLSGGEWILIAEIFVTLA